MEKEENCVVEQHQKFEPSNVDQQMGMEIDQSSTTSLSGDGGMISFSKFFHREDLGTSLKEAWPIVKLSLAVHGISCALNLVEGSMTVSTTTRTRDPGIIFKARALLELLSRNVPASKAIKVLKQGIEHVIIKIGNQEGGLCSTFGITEDQFFRCHKLLRNTPSKAIFEFTACYMFVQENTVAAIGPLEGLLYVQWLVEGCMVKQVRPTQRIKVCNKLRPEWERSRRLRPCQLMEKLNDLRF